MFDNIKNSVPPRQGNENFPEGNAPIAPKSSQGGVEDIFSESDKTAVPPPPFLRPAIDKSPKPAVFQPQTSLPAPKEGVRAESRNGLKKILILGSGVLGVLIILGGAWYGYAKFFKGSGSSVLPETTTKEQGEASENPIPPKTEEDGQKENAPVAPQEEVNEQIVAQPADSDQDGLTDDEEKRLGIDANKVDTDNDGLFEREEVMVYKTDPLNPDTDGDGYLDGDEVKNGYNPKGAGKLFEIK